METSDKSNIIRWIRHFIYIVILVLIDQLTKHWAVVNLKGNKSIKLIKNVLHLEYLENPGAVFGSFSGNLVFLILFTSLVTFLLIYIYNKLPPTKKYNLLRILLVFMIAGGIGNLIDRIRLNYVIDFIYVALINFPVFNFADSYVTLATLIFIIASLLYYKDEDFFFLEKRKLEDNEEE